jgi:release factor glutamine methyltransferase
LTDDPVGNAAQRLAAVGVESARLDARLLWEFAQRSDPPLEGGLARFERFVSRRLAREPLAYIVGRKEFWSIDFAVGPGVLVPRPDSETLIESVCETFADKSAALSVLDLGTGSGCLLIAALNEYPTARGVGVDISPDALDWARRNVATHGLEDRVVLIESGWLEQASPGFDVVLCNPPYIPTNEIGSLAPEVRLFEPRAALDGGSDGCDAYRALAARIGNLLAPGGRAFVEIGQGQETPVRHIFEAGGLVIVDATNDLAGISRCLTVARTP